MAMKTFFYIATLLISFHDELTNGQLSKQELNLDNEFKLLQKPSVKSIKTEYGDIYDCVDFYKQPAFDHPLLKNHTFYPEMKPPNIWKHKGISKYSSGKEALKHLELKKGGCPKGTVPIRRLTKDQFIATKRFAKHYASKHQSNDFPPGSKPGKHFAILGTTTTSSNKYNGARCQIATYAESLAQSQYSLGRLKLENGGDSIQVGWMVNPTVNKDNLTRMFQYYTAGGSHCYNIVCPGFVHTNKKIPIDSVCNVTKRGTYSVLLDYYIYRNSVSGNWWVAIGHYGDLQVLGFWPAQIIKGMGSSPASYVSVGGEAYGPVNPGQPLPPMGNGYLPLNGSEAFITNIMVLDENDKQNVDPPNMAAYTDSSNYGVMDVHYYNKDWGRVMLYGGPKNYYKHKHHLIKHNS